MLREMARRFHVLAPAGMCLPEVPASGGALWPVSEEDVSGKLDAALERTDGKLPLRIVLARGYVFDGATGMPGTKDGTAWYLYCDGDALLLAAYRNAGGVAMLSPFVLDLRQVERIYLSRHARTKGRMTK